MTATAQRLEVGGQVAAALGLGYDVVALCPSLTIRCSVRLSRVKNNQLPTVLASIDITPEYFLSW